MKKTTSHHKAQVAAIHNHQTAETITPPAKHPVPTGLISFPETWLALAFVIFISIVFKPLRRAILSFLDNHAVKVKTELDEARALREEAEQLLVQVQNRQQEAFAEAEKILARAREDAKVFEKTSMADLENMLQRRQTQALEKIALMEATALRDVRNAVVDLALDASRRLLAEHITPEEDNHLLEKTLKQLPKKLH